MQSPAAVLSAELARRWSGASSGEIEIPLQPAVVAPRSETTWAVWLAALAVGALALQTLLLSQLAALDVGIAAAVSGLPLGHRAAVRVRTFASFAPYYGAVFVVAAVVASWRRGVAVAEIARVVGMLAIGLIVAHGVKVTCWRVRPVSPLDGLQLDSFPSGHTVSVSFCVAAALQMLALRPAGRDRWWRATLVAGAVAAVAIGAARVCLQRHWPTDVTAGLLLAVAFWGSAGPATPRGRKAWIGLALGFAVLGLGGAHIVLPSPGARAWHAPAPGRMRLRLVDPETALHSGRKPL